MKALKYILLTLGAAALLSSCGESDPIDERLDSSRAFVTFDTKSGAAYSVNATEGRDLILSITVGAPKGPSMSVDFSVSAPAGEAYEIRKMDGTPLSPLSLTFPEGTGVQSFIFHPTNNDDLDGTRGPFVFTLTGNSANYKLGVNAPESSEGASLRVTVLDDDHPLKDWAGTWNVLEYYEGSFHAVGALDIATNAAADDQVFLKGLQAHGNPPIAVDLALSLDIDAGTAMITNTNSSSAYGPVSPGVRADGAISIKPIQGIIEGDGSIQFDGVVGFIFAPGGPNAGMMLGYYYEDLRLERP